MNNFISGDSTTKKILERAMPRSVRKEYKAGKPVVVTIRREQNLIGYGHDMTVEIRKGKILDARIPGQYGGFGTPINHILDYFVTGDKYERHMSFRLNNAEV